MVAPSSAAAVANEFLELQSADAGYPPIDQMKLQKLVFYAHAWHLGFVGTPLFDEDVYAWPWGPVVPPIYHQFLEFGRKPIAGKRATELEKTGDGPLDYRFVTPAIPGADMKAFIKGVWDTHKKFSGIQLSNATHVPGEPWTIIKDKYGNLETKPLIPNELIAEVFKEKAQRAQQAPAST